MPCRLRCRRRRRRFGFSAVSSSAPVLAGAAPSCLDCPPFGSTSLTASLVFGWAAVPAPLSSSSDEDDAEDDDELPDESESDESDDTDAAAVAVAAVAAAAAAAASSLPLLLSLSSLLLLPLPLLLLLSGCIALPAPCGAENICRYVSVGGMALTACHLGATTRKDSTVGALLGDPPGCLRPLSSILLRFDERGVPAVDPPVCTLHHERPSNTPSTGGELDTRAPGMAAGGMRRDNGASEQNPAASNRQPNHLRTSSSRRISTLSTPGTSQPRR